MTIDHECPRCGAELPAGVSEASCPRCLLQAGLDADDSVERDARGSAPSPADLSRHFPDLEILELVGSGGMGLVYKARQRRLDRVVALKLLAPDIAGEAGFAERFAREARALAKLTHPNIVGIYDFGEAGGMYYFLMEFVDGANLRQLLRAESLDPKQALAIVPKICDALQYAHDKGVVHRDIKPENVMLTLDGKVKIADFGVAKLMRREGNATITLDNKVMGTPVYMAPEQIEHPGDVDHRADVFSLGVVFYEMLTGELPLGRFAPPSHKVKIDVRLDDVVLRALEKERSLRYQRIDEVKTGIQTIVTTAPTDRPAASTAPTAPRDREHRFSRLALAGGICHGLGFFVFIASALFMASRMSQDSFTFRELFVRHGSTTLFTVVSITALSLAGAAFGVSGWIAIARSQGRLRGLWLAVTSVLLLPLPLPASVLLLLLAR